MFVCVCVCVWGGGGPGIPYIMRNKQRPHMNSINASKFGPLWTFFGPCEEAYKSYKIINFP